jgi:hypothetical protein
MAGVDGKGSTVLSDGNPADPTEARVINGAILVKLVPRGTPREGYGSAQIKGGIASKGEAVVTGGAVRVKVV